jgi:hypothetical protein
MICTVMRYVRSAQWANSHIFELKWEYITNFLLGATICGADDNNTIKYVMLLFDGDGDDRDDDDGDRTGNDRKENEECGNH